MLAVLSSTVTLVAVFLVANGIAAALAGLAVGVLWMVSVRRADAQRRVGARASAAREEAVSSSGAQLVHRGLHRAADALEGGLHGDRIVGGGGR